MILVIYFYYPPPAASAKLKWGLVAFAINYTKQTPISKKPHPHQSPPLPLPPPPLFIIPNPFPKHTPMSKQTSSSTTNHDTPLRIVARFSATPIPRRGRRIENPGGHRVRRLVGRRRQQQPDLDGSEEQLRAVRTGFLRRPGYGAVLQRPGSAGFHIGGVRAQPLRAGVLGSHV